MTTISNSAESVSQVEWKLFGHLFIWVHIHSSSFLGVSFKYLLLQQPRVDALILKKYLLFSLLFLLLSLLLSLLLLLLLLLLLMFYCSGQELMRTISWCWSRPHSPKNKRNVFARYMWRGGSTTIPTTHMIHVEEEDINNQIHVEGEYQQPDTFRGGYQIHV